LILKVASIRIPSALNQLQRVILNKK